VTPIPNAELAKKIALSTKSLGGRAILIGGCVRDPFFGAQSKDTDMELFGVQENRIEGLLKSVAANVIRVEGKRSFPVWKAWAAGDGTDQAIDIALPRREVKVGSGHTDFEVTLDPSMSIADAALRRDFTINAIAFDPLTEEFIDPHGGVKDIKAGILRHISPHFAEDPLRVLRGMQFAARFNLTPDPETIGFCQKLSAEDLPKERLFEEWKKLLLKGMVPSKGLQFLRATGWAKRFFPELAALKGVPQDAVWHPEGDALTHTEHCLDAFAKRRTGDEERDIKVGFAVLCHDFGKATHTKFFDGHWRSLGHEPAGVPLAETFMRRMTDQTELIQGVQVLVGAHMAPHDLYSNAKDRGTVGVSDSAIRRLAVRLGKQHATLDELATVCECDHAGRPPLPEHNPATEWLKERAAAIKVLSEQPKPILLGRDLIGLGMIPGVGFKEVLDSTFERQLNGEIATREEAVALARILMIEQERAIPVQASARLGARTDAADLRRDAAGEVQLFYHGTQAPKDFKEFSCDGPPTDDEGIPLSPESGPDPTAFLGAHFAEQRSVAAKFAIRNAGWMKGRPHYFGTGAPNPRILAVGLKIQNPKCFETEDELREFIFRTGSIRDDALLADVMYAKYHIEEGTEAGDEWMAKYDKDEDLRFEVNEHIFLHMPSKEGYEDILRDEAAEFGATAQRALSKEGHDGIRYANGVEGGTGWVAFTTKQVVRAYAELVGQEEGPRFIQEIERTREPQQPVARIRPLPTPRIEPEMNMGGIVR